MYERCFNLTSRPFTSTPFVKHYFGTESIEQSLQSAKTCIDRAAGPVVVIGEAGMGKSLLLAMLEEQYQTHYRVVHLACARLDSREELYRNILFELQLPYQGLNEGELRLALMEYLKPGPQCPQGLLLLVDEADMLSVELLDELRLLTNNVVDGQPRVQLVMAGSQRLEEQLNDPRLGSLNQRIAARGYLCRMSQEETARYVVAHIDRAGGEGERLFPPVALRAIHQSADGCPRYVNQIADQALILAATRGLTVVCEGLVSEAWNDVQNLPGMMPCTNNAADVSDDQWTVIEFGSLDDEEELSSPPTNIRADTPTTEWIPAQPDDGTPIELQSSPESVDSQGVDTDSPAGLGSPPDTRVEAVPEPEPEPEPACEFENPFEEDFDEEESVAQLYLPEIARRNQSSLAVTSGDLQHLHPMEAPLPVEESESMPEPEPATEQRVTPEPVATTDAETESEPESITRIESFSVPTEFGTVSPPATNATDDASYAFTPVESEPVAAPYSESLPGSDQMSSFPTEDTHASVRSGEQTPSNMRVATSSDSLDNIDEIIRSIDSFSESPAPPQPTHEVSNDTSHDDLAETAQKILDNIGTPKNPVPCETGPLSFSEATPSVHHPPAEVPHDDSDMIIASRQDEAPSPSVAVEDSSPIPFPSTPISTGEARRMDYEKLFAQLRAGDSV